MGLLFTLSPLQRAASTSTPPPSGRMPHRAVPVADTHSIRFSTHQLPAADRCGPAATGAAAARLRSGAPAVPGPKAAPPPPAPPQSPAVCCPQPHRRRPLRSPGRRQQPLQSHLVPGDRRRRRHWTRTTEGLCALMTPPDNLPTRILSRQSITVLSCKTQAASFQRISTWHASLPHMTIDQ